MSDKNENTLTNAGLIEFIWLCCSDENIKKIADGKEVKNKKELKQMRDGAIEYAKTILNFFRAWSGFNDDRNTVDENRINVAFMSATVKDANYFYFKYKAYLAPIEKMCAMAYQTSLRLEREAKTREDYIAAWSTKVNWINIIPAVIYCFFTEIDFDDVIFTNRKALTVYFSAMAAMKGGLHVERLDDYLERVMK